MRLGTGTTYCAQSQGLADDGSEKAVVSQAGTESTTFWRRSMGGLRLIAGEQAWWAISGGLAARLPTDAVTDSDASPELWVDTLRGRALVPEAVSALSSAGFFTEARGTYALTVLTATNCNLGCAYCFQNVAPPSPVCQAEVRHPF